MARKSTAQRRQVPKQPESTLARHAVTPERFRRLYRLVQFLGTGPKARDRLLAHLQLDVRGFYRDLELLRSIGISITLHEGRYILDDAEEVAIGRLPFPDPHFTLGEARKLAGGRTRLHEALREQIQQLLA